MCIERHFYPANLALSLLSICRFGKSNGIIPGFTVVDVDVDGTSLGTEASEKIQKKISVKRKCRHKVFDFSNLIAGDNGNKVQTVTGTLHEILSLRMVLHYPCLHP